MEFRILWIDRLVRAIEAASSGPDRQWLEAGRAEAPAPVQQATASVLTSELERLGNLYERKLLTDEEFAQAKARVLEHSASRPVQAPVAAATASPVSSGFPKAGEGTRTLDLLHGNSS